MRPQSLSRSALAVLVATAAVAVAGCGDDESPAGTTSAAGATSTPAEATGKKASDVKIAFLVAASSLNFAQEMMEGAKAAGDELGVEVKTLAPSQVDGPAQVKLLQDAMRTSKDGIAIETLTPPLVARAEAQAVKAGIPVIAVDTAPLPDTGIKTYIGNDNYEAGATLANAAVEALGSSGDQSGTAVVGNPAPGIPTLDNRAKGIAETLKEKLPDYEVKGPFDSKVDPTGNFAAWNNLFNANRDATIYLDGGDSANASLSRLNRSNGSKKLTGAFDLNPAGIKAVEDGVNFGFVDPEHFLKGYLAVRLLAEKATQGKALPEGWYKNPAVLVDKSNVADIKARQETRASKLAFFKPQIDKLFAGELPVQPISEAR